VPVAVALAVMAEPFILAFYGAKWAEAVLPMQLLAFYALIVALGFNLGDVYKAIGRPQVLTWINLFNLVLAAPILLIAARWGLWGVALGQVAVATAITVVNWVVARRVVGIGAGVLMAAAWAPLLAALAMAGACVVVDVLLLGAIAPAGRLAVLVALGIPTYCGALLLLVPDLPTRLRAALRQRAAASAGAAGAANEPPP
jgi:O-antigen/teichoic acid export membrane protein